MEEKERLALTLFLFAVTSVRDFYLAESISAKRLAIKENVSFVLKARNKNVDVERTLRLSHATL